MGLWRLHLVGHELSAFYERLLDVVVMAFVGVGKLSISVVRCVAKLLLCIWRPL